jgi:hypothetical protein
MRVEIEGERDLVTGLADGFAEVESVDGTDLTEQKFGFAEAATIIATVQSLAEIAKLVTEFVRARAARGTTKPQTLRLRTAIGTVVVEVDPETTVEQLQEALGPLTPQR